LELMKKYRGNNRDDLSLTYSEIKWKIKSSATASKAFKQLVTCGFFRVIRPGGLYRRCTIYGISGEWKTFSGKHGSPVVVPNQDDDTGKDLDPVLEDSS
jgi:hypothetical protein